MPKCCRAIRPTSTNPHFKDVRLLVAVISLPSGVFNPYSGVKTSILILDKVLAPKTDRVAFFKVENDGYDLGAQRRPIDKDDLPAVIDEISEYLSRLREEESLEDYQLTLGHVVAKSKISATGEYNLSGERYNTRTKSAYQYLTVKLGEPGLFEIVSGGTPKSTAQSTGTVTFLGSH